MGHRVAGKVALITGGASGLGEAAAQRLAGEGAVVVISDVNVAAGEAVAQSIARTGAAASFMAHDAASEGDWDRVVADVLAEHGKLDVLFNNAGIGTTDSSPIEDMSLQTWRATLSVNLDGVFLGLRAGIRAMKQGSGGSIINTSSIYGIVSAVGIAAYSASKGGVRTLTKAAALECARAGHGIRVNSVHPGHIDTPMIAHRVATRAGRDALTARYPVGHLGEPLDIANAVLFLASDESKFMTGAELVVDGGFTAQ
jgi:NAD(P)-dependent dehydrogenase (short-subunit alcohol dehydrogenase family)